LIPEVNKLQQLEYFYLGQNGLTSIPPEISQMTQLCMLLLFFNKITYLPNEMSQMRRLHTLDIGSNMFVQLPLWIIYMPNLQNFFYDDNEITDVAPAITRWLNSSKSCHNVYSNGQNVHDVNIQLTTNTSIINFIKSEKPSATDAADIINSLDLTDHVKNILKSYTTDNHVHSNLRLTFGEVLAPVLHYIKSHPSNQELCKILSDEMESSVGKCLQGRLSRLISVLSGYHPAVAINISQNEQISNVVIMLKKKMPNASVDDFVAAFVAELQDRNYEPNVISEWTGYVVDNY
jgi:hypothetical protein